MLKRPLESSDERSSGGQRQETLEQSGTERMVTGASTFRASSSQVSSLLSLPSQQQVQLKPSMQESLRESSYQTFNTKLLHSQPSIPITSSSAIVPVASISSEKASYRFFNSRLKDVYRSCVLPTVTDCAASHTISSSTFSQSTELKSKWRMTTHMPPSGSWQRTSSLSSPFLGLVCTDVGQEGLAKRRRGAVLKPEHHARNVKVEEQRKRKTPFQRAAALDGCLRTFKVRMIPTQSQIAELKRCFAVARLRYNQTNALIKGGAQKNRIRLRNEVLAMPQPEWADGKLKVARSIQESAVSQCVAAYSTNEAKRRINPAHGYEVRYRSLKNNYTEIIQIQKDNDNTPQKKNSTLLRFEAAPPLINRKGRAECLAFFGNNFGSVGGIRMADKERVISQMVADGNRLHEDCKIIWDKRARSFHFIYTVVQPKLEDPDPTFADKRIASNDPGCHPFQAWYSPTSNRYGVLLDGVSDALEMRCLAIDALTSRVTKREKGPDHPKTQKTGRQRRRTTRALRRKLARERRRLHGWIENGHYAAANFMLQNHDIIIQPNLEVSRLVQRRKRKIQSSTVRKMYTLSHYKYRQRLISAASRYPGRYVIVSREPGTSRTCTDCGFWHSNLKVNQKTFCCPRCKVTVDRDVAGARNNFFSEYGRAVGIGWDGESG